MGIVKKVKATVTHRRDQNDCQAGGIVTTVKQAGGMVTTADRESVADPEELCF